MLTIFSEDETNIIELETQKNITLNNPKTLFIKGSDASLKIEELINLKSDSNDESNLGRDLENKNSIDIEFVAEKRLHLKDDFLNKKKIIDSVFAHTKEFEFKEIMAVTHGGFLTEFFRLIRLFKGLDPESRTKFDNTSINCVRIYCENCAGKCYKQEQQCRLVMDIIFQNNTIHLDFCDFI